MPKRQDEYWAGTKEPKGRGLCPFCGSPDVHYSKRLKSWRCGKCEKTFPSPSYGPGKDSGKEARLYGKTTAQLRAELRAESVPPVTAHQERVPRKDKNIGLRIAGVAFFASVLLIGISIFLVSYFVYSNRSSGDNVEPGIETFTSPLAILSSPIPQQAPTQELKELIQYMLDLINKDRDDYGLAPVVLGNNIAAQKHAEEMLEHSYLSHWGMDGLKPYMRYTLEGGYNYEAENVSGLLSPLEENGKYSEKPPEELLRETQEGFMDSPGHRENILNKWHKKVNLGIACNQYTCSVAQQFEGDYIEFSELPHLSDGVLTMSGQLFGGFSFDSIHVWYDEPPHSLTFGQLGATRSSSLG